MINIVIFACHILFVGLVTLVATVAGADALIVWISLQAVIANLFVTKQVVLCGLQVTATDAYMIGAYIGANLLQEFYGLPSARRSLYISTATVIVFVFASLIHLGYIPAHTDCMHPYFATILLPVPRIVIASIVSYLIAQVIELNLYRWFKQKFQTHYLVLRNYGSLAISQLIDTVLFSVLGLYGMVNNIGHIIIFSYIIKLVVIGLNGPIIGLIKQCMKSRENS